MSRERASEKQKMARSFFIERGLSTRFPRSQNVFARGCERLPPATDAAHPREQDENARTRFRDRGEGRRPKIVRNAGNILAIIDVKFAGQSAARRSGGKISGLIGESGGNRAIRQNSEGKLVPAAGRLREVENGERCPIKRGVIDIRFASVIGINKVKLFRTVPGAIE